MAAIDPAILRYLCPPGGSFWRWDDGGRGLAWAGGETVGFRDELLAIFDRLAATADERVPPFAAVVLLLAASRDNWPAARPRLVAHAERLAEAGGGVTTAAIGVALRAVGHRLGANAAVVTAGLDRVASLPTDLRRSPAAKATLAEVVFEGIDPLPGLTASATAAALRQGLDPATFDDAARRSTAAALHDLIDAMAVLRPGLDNLDPEQLAARLQTGLDGPVRPAAVELGPTERARALLSDLSPADPDVAAVARLARGLLAAVAVPRPVGSPHDQPAGGVSDLSNRGPLDRLLLSELAHDDLTLTVRVAVNEALYLQRETPPRHPPRRRAVLVDTGVRTWGVPRVFAAAVALALTATADADGDVVTYRPGQPIERADLTTRPGLSDHLATLDGRGHFGNALPAFVAALGDDAEPFLVLTDDALDDADLRRALRDHGPEPTYAATVSRDGAFRLWHLSSAGRRLVRSAQLDLDTLLAGPKQAVPLASADLPTILTLRPFPLRLPPTSRLAAVAAGESVVAITDDGRLLHWDDVPHFGPAQVADGLPRGRVRFLGLSGDRAVAVVDRHPRGADVNAADLIVVGLTDGSVSIRPLPDLRASYGFTVRDNVLFAIEVGRVAAYPLATGERAAEVSTAAHVWVGGRVFRRSLKPGVQFAVAAFVGDHIDLRPIPVPASLPPAVVFEPKHAAGDGPLAAWLDGRVTATLDTTASLADTAVLKSARGLANHLVFSPQIQMLSGTFEQRSDGRPVRYGVDFRPGPPSPRWRRWPAVAGLPDYAAVLPPHHWLPGRVRTRFTAVGVDAEGSLYLQARDRQTWGFGGDGVRPVGLIRWGGNEPDDRWRPFEPVDPRPGRWRLHVAKWPDGSRAFLDGRGMLHLCPADQAVPQLTLVLVNNGPVVGWSTDGRVFGDGYYHGRDDAAPAAELNALLDRFTEALR